jgi:N-acetylmuramoyl-L-alanine amidase/PKD repeat protein
MLKRFLICLLLIYSTSYVVTGQLNGIKICIDPGHGGYDPANDRKIELPYGLIFWESEGNLMTANHASELLTLLGANVKLTRTENTDASDISLSARSTIANEFGADFFLSNHTNAGGGGNNYSLVLYKGEDNSPAWPQAKVMGSFLAPGLQDLLRTTNYHNRGDISFLTYNLGVLKNTNMPAVLSEGSFHDLNDEAFRLKNFEYSRNYAWAVARAFCTYFNTSGFPTGRIGGIVTDRSTGQVLNNIGVTLNPGNKSYNGDDFYNGFYAFGDLNPGSYDLIFSRSGYLSVSKQILVEANKYTETDVSLPLDNNGIPFADFDITGLPAGPGDVVVFNAQKSADDGQIVKYEWDFGDGNTTDTGKIISHIYLADGTYSVTLKLTDDELNTSARTKNVEIKSIPPEFPVILSAQYKKNDNKITIRWKKLSQSGISGYRIYYNDQFSPDTYNILADTNILKNNTGEYIFENPGRDNYYTFKISSFNKSGVESIPGNTYGVLLNSNMNNKTILVVDGFDRRSSYTGSTHDFSGKTYIRGLFDASAQADVSSCSNETIISGEIDLNTFNAVIWYLGDESTTDETFSLAEQNKIKDYLNSGGKLFVTGSEIAWDLDYKGSVADKNFYHEYFKAVFLEDGSSGRSPATGVQLTDFSDLKLTYGVVYPEDFPDVISPTGGSVLVFKYNQGSSAGIAYKGTFGGNWAIGAVMHLGFPLETVKDKEEIKLFFRRLMKYFDFIVSDQDVNIASVPYYIFPTVFSESINIETHNENEQRLDIQIFSLTGNILFSEKIILRSQFNLNLKDFQAGMYIIRIINKGKAQSFKIIKY